MFKVIVNGTDRLDIEMSGNLLGKTASVNMSIQLII